MEHVTARDEFPAALAIPEGVKTDHAIFFLYRGAVLGCVPLESELREGADVSGGKARGGGAGKRISAVTEAVGGEGEVEKEQGGGGDAEEEEEEGGEEGHDNGLKEEGKELWVWFRWGWLQVWWRCSVVMVRRHGD